MSAPDSTSRLPTPEEQEIAARSRIRADARRRLKAQLSEWVAYWFLLGGSALVLLISWWKTEQMYALPLKFPFAVQYASVESQELTYALEFPDELGIPKSTRLRSKPERTLPYMVVAESPKAAQFERSLQPANKKLELVIPKGVDPGDWSGKLRFSTPQGTPVGEFLVSFRVADPWRLWKFGAIGFVLITGLWYGLLIYFRPALCASVLLLELTAHERREAADPAKKVFRVSWLRRWILLPCRHWVPLREINSRMPSGRLLCTRRGLLPGSKRILLKLELDAVETTPMVLAHHWPKSTKDLFSLGGKPTPRIDIPVKGAFSGQPWCIVGCLDQDKNALAFSILHPYAKPSKTTS